VIDFHEHSNESSCSIKGGEFLVTECTISLSRRTLLHGVILLVTV
jgi:hypothetical protein